MIQREVFEYPRGHGRPTLYRVEPLYRTSQLIKMEIRGQNARVAALSFALEDDLDRTMKGTTVRRATQVDLVKARLTRRPLTMRVTAIDDQSGLPILPLYFVVAPREEGQG